MISSGTGRLLTLMAQALQTANRATLLGFSGYHWLVIAAGWAGWGFDVFDALLFNFVAPNCVPVLLHMPYGSPEARSATVLWTGLITSILLVGWAVGGVLFGWVADRIGRKQALFATVALYAGGTALRFGCLPAWVLGGSGESVPRSLPRRCRKTSGSKRVSSCRARRRWASS